MPLVLPSFALFLSGGVDRTFVGEKSPASLEEGEEEEAANVSDIVANNRVARERRGGGAKKGIVGKKATFIYYQNSQIQTIIVISS